jgi:hypothetical protein
MTKTSELKAHDESEEEETLADLISRNADLDELYYYEEEEEEDD